MKAKLPARLHHTAYVTKDLEKTRPFYEDVIGLPLIATWCETDKLFGKERTYCHSSSAWRRRRAGVLPVRRSGGPGRVRAARCRHRRSITSR